MTLYCCVVGIKATNRSAISSHAAFDWAQTKILFFASSFHNWYTLSTMVAVFPVPVNVLGWDFSVYRSLVPYIVPGKPIKTYGNGWAVPATMWHTASSWLTSPFSRLLWMSSLNSIIGFTSIKRRHQRKNPALLTFELPHPSLLDEPMTHSGTYLLRTQPAHQFLWSIPCPWILGSSRANTGIWDIKFELRGIFALVDQLNPANNLLGNGRLIQNIQSLCLWKQPLNHTEFLDRIQGQSLQLERQPIHFEVDGVNGFLWNDFLGRLKFHFYFVGCDVLHDAIRSASAFRLFDPNFIAG